MRGDLLPQAVQEWDTILSASPDRLDARTGLLETYWREGVYEKVEQLAKEILRDVPHCLKDRKSTRLNSSHSQISYAVFCLKKKKKKTTNTLISINQNVARITVL